MTCQFRYTDTASGTGQKPDIRKYQLYIQTSNPGLNPGFGVLRFGLRCNTSSQFFIVLPAVGNVLLLWESLIFSVAIIHLWLNYMYSRTVTVAKITPCIYTTTTSFTLVSESRFCEAAALYEREKLCMVGQFTVRIIK
jgi:hypothetical protein